MCTKWFSDGDVHKYFNPYDSPYDAFISYMNALHDLELRLERYDKVDENTVSNNIYKDENTISNKEVKG
jgi:alpha-amylase